MMIRRGDFVKTWFDTGAMGAQILFGIVIMAGPTTYTVMWESGLRNRLRVNDKRVTPLFATDVPDEVRTRLRAMKWRDR
jgi:hypothetical protein